MKNFRSLMTCCGMILVVGFVTGCAQEGAEPVAEEVTVDGTKYLLTDEPEGAADVINVRKDAEEGDDVLITGRIGGRANPWIEGQAAFTIVDDSLKACSDIPGDKCKKPWDYCCETHKLPGATALVKVVDDEGNLVKADARKLLDVKELSTVVIKGKAKRDDEGNLTVLANSIYVKK